MDINTRKSFGRPPRLATIPEAVRAGYLNESCLRRMRDEGELPGFKTGNRFYINLDALDLKLSGKG